MRVGRRVFLIRDASCARLTHGGALDVPGVAAEAAALPAVRDLEVFKHVALRHITSRCATSVGPSGWLSKIDQSWLIKFYHVSKKAILASVSEWLSACTY